MNLTILLAAGKSSRFGNNMPKQLFPIDGKPIILHSIELFKDFTEILVVTNTSCFNEISKLTTNVVINDTDTRYDSLVCAWKWLEDKSVDKIIIHDAARPFVPQKYIEPLLKNQGQYYLSLTNGLIHKQNDTYITTHRQDFLELCTPQMLKFESFKEMITIGKYVEAVTLFKDYQLLEGHYKYLRKITTANDLFTTQDCVLE